VTDEARDPLDEAREASAAALLSLADAILRAAPGGPSQAVLDAARLRAEVERAVAAIAARPSQERPLRASLLASLDAAHPGLSALLPEGAPLAVLPAAFARLHGHVAALAVTASKRSPHAPAD